MLWKKGRGTLGPLAPLIGRWRTSADSPRGPVICTRTFAPVLGGKYVELRATWQVGKDPYEEVTLFGADAGKLAFWSFTSDGKRSAGQLTQAPEVHPAAICFEAQVPAGAARMVYWPPEEDGFNWAVESKNAKGWHRFLLHHYRAVL